MGTDWTWSKALKTFADSGQKVAESSEVLSTNWFKRWEVKKNADQHENFKEIYDVWWTFNYEWRAGPVFRTVYQYVAGVNIDYGVVDAEGGALNRFIHEAQQILIPVSSDVRGNDTTSLGSFDIASTTARGMEWRIQAAMEEIDRWVKGIDVPDSAWQGSAAGVFRATLQGMSNALERLRQEMINPRDFTIDIDHARFQLKTSLDALRGIHTNWLNDRMAAPINAAHDAVVESFQGAQIGQDTDKYAAVQTVHGDPTTQEFWDRVQQRAKEMWQYHVSEHLDKPAGLEMGEVEGAYSRAISAIPQSLTQFHLRMPASPGPKLPPEIKPPPGSQLPGVDDLTQSLSQQMGGDGTSGNGGGGAGPVLPHLTPMGGESLKNAMFAGSPNIGQSQGPSGGSKKVVGPNGETLTGADGMPIIVPQGAKINSNGTVTGSDGKPLKGPNGKPLSLPRGARLGSLTEPLSGGTLSGSRLPQKLGGGFNALSSGKVGGGGGGGGKFEPSMPTKFSTSSGPMEMSGGPVGERNAFRSMARNSNGELVTTQTGMGARALKAGGSLPMETASVMGGNNGTGSPMVPPMSPGGMGGGPQGGGGDRQRQTWLDEDAGVWGTDEGTAPGVIGR
jgi:uncharacterized protein YukE